VARKDIMDTISHLLDCSTIQQFFIGRQSPKEP